MDRSKRMARTADRVLVHLAHFPKGVSRSDLVRRASSNDYRIGAEALDACVNDGRVEEFSVGGRRRYRLTLAGVDEIAVHDPCMVSYWLDMDLKSGWEFHDQRLALTGGRDIALHPGAKGERPRYLSAWGVMSDDEYAFTFDEKWRAVFLAKERFWRSEPEADARHRGDFWDESVESVLEPAELVGFWG